MNLTRLQDTVLIVQ